MHDIKLVWKPIRRSFTRSCWTFCLTKNNDIMPTLFQHGFVLAFSSLSIAYRSCMYLSPSPPSPDLITLLQIFLPKLRLGNTFEPSLTVSSSVNSALPRLHRSSHMINFIIISGTSVFHLRSSGCIYPHA